MTKAIVKYYKDIPILLATKEKIIVKAKLKYITSLLTVNR